MIDSTPSPHRSPHRAPETPPALFFCALAQIPAAHRRRAAKTPPPQGTTEPQTMQHHPQTIQRPRDTQRAPHTLRTLSRALALYARALCIASHHSRARQPQTPSGSEQQTPTETAAAEHHRRTHRQTEHDRQQTDEAGQTEPRSTIGGALFGGLHRVRAAEPETESAPHPSPVVPHPLPRSSATDGQRPKNGGGGENARKMKEKLQKSFYLFPFLFEMVTDRKKSD